MQKSNSATGPCGRMRAGLTKNRREAGTSLVEILVVIVIFLIGILAVVQIFPRGFALLLTTRNNSAATALGRDMVERLKANPDLIPDEVVPVRYTGSPATLVVDTTRNPLALGPTGDSLSAAGTLSNGGLTVARDWFLASGANVARRIIGEGHRLPAAREVGAIGTGTAQYESYGGLLLLDHGPIDPGPDVTKPNLVAYANDLSRALGAPVGSSEPGDANSPAVTTVSANGAPVQQIYADGTATNLTSATMVSTPATTAPFEYFVVNPDTPDAAVYLPANHAVTRTYRIRMSAYVGSGAGYRRYDYLSLSVRVPATENVAYPLVRVRLADLLAQTAEVKGGGTMANVEPESVRVAPQYVNVADPSRPSALQGKWTTAAELGLSSANPNAPVDPFEMKVVDPRLGVLLFSPAARNGVVDRPGGTSEPLIARVDYDVRDWRILNEDFRVVNGNATFQLSLQSLKVGSNNGPDGLFNGGLFTPSRTFQSDLDPIDPFPTPRDNVVLVDVTTGFEVQRYRTSAMDANGRTLADSLGSPSVGQDVFVSVDKSRGSVTLNDADPNVAGLNVFLIPPTGTPIEVEATNRTFRVLYRARQEWSVQLFKAASQYSVLYSAPSPATFGADQCFVGGGSNVGDASKLYFPPSEVGHKITIDRIVYSVNNGPPQILEGQDFVLRTGNDSTSYAYASLGEVVKNATFSDKYGVAAQGVKGASLSVRVLWNPEAFSLTADSATNMDRADKWARGWRKSTTETYLRAEESR